MFGRVEELIVVLLIVLVLFGGKKIPELARNIGQSVREVKKGFTEEEKPVASKREESNAKS
ncbi:MAG TPA: twin-arginine translocase TatA/TatE family subunit [Candidatus Saccharimonadales bacterium]